jgi:hypothetical protein
VPLVALTEYWKDEGENGPPGGPETAMLVSGVTTNAGAGGRALGGSNGRHQQSLRSSEYKSPPYQPYGRHGVFVSFIERAVQDTRPDLADRGLFVTLRPARYRRRSAGLRRSCGGSSSLHGLVCLGRYSMR